MVESQKRSYEVQFCTDVLEKKIPMEMLNILPVGGRGKGLITPKTSLVKPTIFNSFRNILGRGHFYNKTLSLNNDFRRKEYDRERSYISTHVESIRQGSNIYSVDKVNVCAGVSIQAEKTRQQITSNIINISDDLEKQLKKKPICMVESTLKEKYIFDNNGFDVGTSRYRDSPSPEDNPVTSSESSYAFSMQKILKEKAEKNCHAVNVSLNKKEDVSLSKVLTTTENPPYLATEVIQFLDDGSSECSNAKEMFQSGKANICDKSDPDTRSTNRKSVTSLSMTSEIDNHLSIHASTCSIVNRIKSDMKQSKSSINTEYVTEDVQSCSSADRFSDCEAQEPSESNKWNVPEKLQIEDVIINNKQPKFTLTRNFSSEGINNHSKPGSPIIAEIPITKKICYPLLVNQMYYNDKEYLKTLHEKDLFLVIEHIASSVIDEVEQLIKSFGNLVLFLVEPDILDESESFTLVKMSESSECEFVVSCLDGYIWGMKRLKVRRVVDILEA